MRLGLNLGKQGLNWVGSLLGWGIGTIVEPQGGGEGFWIRIFHCLLNVQKQLSFECTQLSKWGSIYLQEANNGVHQQRDGNGNGKMVRTPT